MTTRQTPRRRDGGFTLVELIVVVVIIGVLAAIAVPVFLGQRQKAEDSATKSDLSNFAVQMAAAETDLGRGMVASELEAWNPELHTSSNVMIMLAWSTASDFCFIGINSKGSRTSYGGSEYYWVTSTSGVGKGYPTCAGEETKPSDAVDGGGAWTANGYAGP